jgi:thiol-disulfide isomerase/thioredoxin
MLKMDSFEMDDLRMDGLKMDCLKIDCLKIERAMKTILSSILCVCALLPASSFAEIYKCKVNGKLVFTDQPCEGGKVTLGETNSMAAEEQPFEYEPLQKAYSSSQWYYGHAGYKRALRVQKKYNAPIFLYFQADWCSYCRELEKGLINTSQGAKVLRNVVKVKITPEDSKRDDDFFRRLGGTGYPTVLLQKDSISSPQTLQMFSNKKLMTANTLSQVVDALIVSK